MDKTFNEAIEQAERNSLMDDLKIMNELNSMCLDFEEEKKDYESFKKAYENNKKAISNHERNVFFHEKVLKNKRLQLLINEDVLTDLKTEARSHDISVNELVNRLIQSFLYEGGE